MPASTQPPLPVALLSVPMPSALELDKDMSERGAGAKAARREAAQDASTARFRTTALINLASILEKCV